MLILWRIWMSWPTMSKMKSSRAKILISNNNTNSHKKKIKQPLICQLFYSNRIKFRKNKKPRKMKKITNKESSKNRKRNKLRINKKRSNLKSRNRRERKWIRGLNWKKMSRWRQRMTNLKKRNKRKTNKRMIRRT